MIFEKGDKLTDNDGSIYEVKKFISQGGQGEIYEVTNNNQSFALKWYYKTSATNKQKDIISNLISKGNISENFILPMQIVTSNKNSNFGYVMKLIPKNYYHCGHFVYNKVDIKFSELIKAGILLAKSLWNLHSKGLCYSDISEKNIFLNPDTGNILICDNDNVVVSGNPDIGIQGTKDFMAPEIIRGESKPSIETDRYSLAVLLFYMFFMGHPLEGKIYNNIRIFDENATTSLYGKKPIFIFDPNDDSNRPEKGLNDNPINFWEIYPDFLKDLFTKSFTSGIKDPQNERVTENEWMKNLSKLLDSLIYCPNCGRQNFYDENKKTITCWNCKQSITLPFQLKLNNHSHRIMINFDFKLYKHHIFPSEWDFANPIGKISQSPKNPKLWGLTNLTDDKWTIIKEGGEIVEVPNGKNAVIKKGTKINFGNNISGEIEYNG